MTYERAGGGYMLPGTPQKSYKFFCRGLDIRVSEHMRRDMQFNGCEGNVFIDHPPDCLIGERRSVQVCKKMIAVLNFICERPTVFLQNICNLIASNLYSAFLCSLTVDQDCPVIQVHIAHLQGTEL